MSHTPQTPNPPVQVIVQQSENNGIGLAGFICSLISLFTCGILFPIGFLLSLIGVFFRPRGFAIAGLVISGGAVGIFVLSWFLFLGTLFGFGAAGVAGVAAIANMSSIEQMSAAVDTIENSSKVQAKLGTPVKCEPTGEQRHHKDGEVFEITQAVRVEGPKGSGEGEIVMLLSAESFEWSTKSIEVTIDGETINLSHEGDFSLDIGDPGE